MPTGSHFCLGKKNKKHCFPPFTTPQNFTKQNKPLTKTFVVVSNQLLLPPISPRNSRGLLMQRLQLFVLFDPAMKHTQMPRGRLSPSVAPPGDSMTVTCWSPIWRSQKSFKGSRFHHPKKVTKSCQVFSVCKLIALSGAAVSLEKQPNLKMWWCAFAMFSFSMFFWMPAEFFVQYKWNLSLLSLVMELMNLQAFCWWKCRSYLPSLKLTFRTCQEGIPKGKDGLPTINFQVLLLLVSVRVTLEESKIPWLDKKISKILLHFAF